jgi:WD40 repeat protein
VIFWDLADPAAPRQLGRPIKLDSGGAETALSPDGRLLATTGTDPFTPGAPYEAIVLWDLGDPATPRRHARPITFDPSLRLNPVSAMAFSPDGRILATGVGATVILWDVGDPDQARPLGQPLPGHGGQEPVAFSPDGRTLAVVASDGTVILWNLADPARPSRIGQPLTGGSTKSLAFSPDGRTLATGLGLDEALLWDLTDRAQPRRLGQSVGGELGNVSAVAFVSGRRALATATSIDAVALWDLTGLHDLQDHAVEHACARTGHGLNPDEWARYIPGLAYQNTCAP